MLKALVTFEDAESGIWERTLLFRRGNIHPSVRERVQILKEEGRISVFFTPVPLDLVVEQHKAVYPVHCKAYGFVLSEGKISAFVNGESESGLTSDSHLQDLARKLTKWCINHAQGYKKRVIHDVIVPHCEFQVQYAKLKAKYSHWVKDWSEKTDPVKFVFEDILISAFLLCLWSGTTSPATAKREFHFVDLGCGNGFLTHILTEEGFSGKGIDLRRRKIWSRFSCSAQLEERMIDPVHETFDAEWIIGNHADELVPHIPGIASRSKARFFVLPCCFFDLEGKKFTLSCKGGRYANFLLYVEGIIRDRGWKVERETLRIPSTKNIAFIGRASSATDSQ